MNRHQKMLEFKAYLRGYLEDMEIEIEALERKALRPKQLMATRDVRDALRTLRMAISSIREDMRND